jgi:hypothetical protein
VSTPKTTTALSILDCYATFRGIYKNPQLLQLINFEKLTEAILNEFRTYNIAPTDITLERGDGLFGYSIKAHLLNRLITFTSTAVNLEASFARLIRGSDRTIGADCLRKIVGIGRDYLTENCYFEIGLHARFASDKSRDAFFMQDNQSHLQLVGTLGYKKLPDSDQMVRLQVDQSWVFPSAAYITWSTIGMKLTQLLEPEPIWTPFFQMLEPLQLQVTDE